MGIAQRAQSIGLTEVALAIGGLHKSFLAGIAGCFAQARVLVGVDLEVRAGEIVGIVGPVGSGKTTLLLCAAGMLRPDAGSVSVFGAPAPHAAAGYVSAPPGPGFETPSQALGRVLSEGAHVLLLDGVVPSLSPGACRLLSQLAERGVAIVAADRDRSALAALAHRMVVLRQGTLSPLPPLATARATTARRRATRIVPLA